jgi:hypothetical protein
MDPVSLIETSLAAGATAGTHETASQAINDAYAGLKALVNKRFVGSSLAEMVLAEYEKDEETWQKPLQKLLVKTGAYQDEAIVQQAQMVLQLVNPQQASLGMYNVQISEGRGIVIGDNAQVIQNFGEKYAPPPGEPPDIPLPPKSK